MSSRYKVRVGKMREVGGAKLETEKRIPLLDKDDTDQKVVEWRQESVDLLTFPCQQFPRDVYPPCYSPPLQVLPGAKGILVRLPS